MYTIFSSPPDRLSALDRKTAIRRATLIYFRLSFRFWRLDSPPTSMGDSCKRRCQKRLKMLPVRPACQKFHETFQTVSGSKRYRSLAFQTLIISMKATASSAQSDSLARRILPETGLEPARLSAPDPKSGASANSATLASQTVQA